MNNVHLSCYMCDNHATSKEHVPPKCLFPEKKDLPKDMDLRKNLFKVPSCDMHNSQKSNDDEFLLYVLSTSFQINEIGNRHYLTKVRRAAKRNSSILGKIAETATPASYKDTESNKFISSVAYKLEPDRFNMIVDRLAHAIYFLHFGEKWEQKIKYQAEFLFATLDHSNEANIHIKEISRQADEWFTNIPFYGDNPEVFKYQVIVTNQNRIMRLYFYEGCKLLLIFNSQQKQHFQCLDDER
jgi:hypothetical protein